MDKIQDLRLFLDVVKVLILGTIAFIVAIFWTPILTNILYKYRLGKSIRISKETPIYSKLHQKKEGTPTMGGILVWLTTLILAIIFWILAKMFPKNWILGWLNFLNRPETLLPLGALIATAIVGLIDDLMNVFKIGPAGGGLRIKHKLFLYTIIAIFGAWWFYYKLDWDIIHIPGVGDFSLGWLYIPLFIIVIVATSFSVNEADGLDGLAGGILLSCFSAYSALAFSMGKINLSAFCAVICGALLAFLWFNIYPARFFMGDTGAMSLGTTLGIIAMLTNSAIVLPIIALPLVIESGSVILQLISKKFFGKKIFKSTPIHHHFEAIGWPETKITMRFWIIAIVSSILGFIIGIIGKG